MTHDVRYMISISGLRVILRVYHLIYHKTLVVNMWTSPTVYVVHYFYVHITPWWWIWGHHRLYMCNTTQLHAPNSRTLTKVCYCYTPVTSVNWLKQLSQPALGTLTNMYMNCYLLLKYHIWVICYNNIRHRMFAIRMIKASATHNTHWTN